MLICAFPIAIGENNRSEVRGWVLSFVYPCSDMILHLSSDVFFSLYNATCASYMHHLCLLLYAVDGSLSSVMSCLCYWLIFLDFVEAHPVASENLP